MNPKVKAIDRIEFLTFICKNCTIKEIHEKST